MVRPRASLRYVPTGALTCSTRREPCGEVRLARGWKRVSRQGEGEPGLSVLAVSQIAEDSDKTERPGVSNRSADRPPGVARDSASEVTRLVGSETERKVVHGRDVASSGRRAAKRCILQPGPSRGIPQSFGLGFSSWGKRAGAVTSPASSNLVRLGLADSVQLGPGSPSCSGPDEASRKHPVPIQVQVGRRAGI